ncbi:MAG: zf-HC2 domain-containing protein [Chloroflexi bacterium]|nr:zf-HC2 domain-containing protein [Chloroflexota bacterium]
MSHDELSDLAAGYALSALDSDDLKIFEAHLATCPECQVSVARLRPLVDALSMMNEPAEPADDLRERILAAARAESRGSVRTREAILAKRAPWWRRPVLWPLPVAAVFTILAAVIVVVSVWGSQADGDLSSAQRRLDLTYDGLEIMAQAEHWWRFDGSNMDAGVAGTLAYSEESGAACLLVWGLPEGDELSYQVRLTQADGEVTVQRMWRNGEAMWLILETDPGLLQKLEVTRTAGESQPDSDLPALIDIPLASS